jgi:transposase
MDRFIGLDAHKTSCTFAVLDQKGKELKSQVVETHGQALVEFIRLIPGRRHLCIEEGTHSQWLYEILSPHTYEIAVVPGEKKQGNKSDAVDALELAERIRTGSLRTKVYKAPKAFATLRELTRTYGMITSDVVRNKNRIKSFYRSRGIQSSKKTDVLEETRREQMMMQLRPGARRAVGFLCEALDSLEEIKDEAQKAMTMEARKHTITKILETAPGLGPVRVAQLLAIVVTPHRFRTSRQFWCYCGLAVVLRTSADWEKLPNGKWVRSPSVKTCGLNRNCNPMLKAIFKGAATTVITQMHTSPLYSDYQRLLDGGLKPDLAKVTIARKIAAIVLAMWKNEEVYSPAYQSNEKA